MTPRLTAGRRVTAAMTAALRRAGESAGHTLAWDEHEAELVARAADAADRREAFRRLFDAELAGEKRPDHLAKLDTSIRQCDKLIATFTARAIAGLKPAKSARHQAAVNHRWTVTRRQERELREANHGA
jgi:hypothetical protein